MTTTRRLFLSIVLGALLVFSIPMRSPASTYDETVYQAQKSLKQFGYNPGSLDGMWGQLTERTVESFQKDVGLPVTGRLDERTRVVLDIVTTYRGFKVGEKVEKRRIALVIGNSTYKSGALKNPANDAYDMSSALGQFGFDVLHYENADRRVMEESIRKFGNLLKDGDVGLFYFAGHGIQMNGRNYLLPVDAEIETESDIQFEAVDTGRVLGKMKDAGNELNIVILDACRDNPFAPGFRSGGGGLARMDGPKGSLVAYATAPGSVAADGQYRNGLFTHYLLRYMTVPGLKIEEVLKEVRIRVMSETGDRQVPWQSSSLTGDFYFNPDEATSAGMPLERESQAPPAPLPSVSLSSGLADFDNIIQKRKAKKDKWALWQAKMENDFAKAEQYDRSFELTPEEKAEAWTSFLSFYRADNPYSPIDNRLREKAGKSLDYWKTYRVAALDPVPRDTSPPYRTKVVRRDGPFIAYANGIVRDNRTGLEWIAGPERPTSWHAAKIWVDNLNIAGGGWRLPISKELKTLYRSGAGRYNRTPLLKTKGWWIWCEEIKGPFPSWIFNFRIGVTAGPFRDRFNRIRILAVRINR